MGETIIGQLADGRLLVEVSQAGPNPYATGGITINVASLGKIDAVLSVRNEDGYKTDPDEATISNNSILQPVRFHGYACTGAPNSTRGYEVLNGANLSATTFTAIVLGH